jgi:CubicO group peptidase (beta-lactamase class C family)
MRSDVWLGAAALGLVLLGTGCGDADARDEARLEVLFRQLDEARMEAGIPGLAVGVLRDGEVLALRGFGFADLDTAWPVTPDTPFDLASVMKPMSATLAMRLQEDGVLDLDAPMSGYRDFDSFCMDARDRGGLFFDDWACDDPGITLRHVLSMTSNGELGEEFFYNPVVFSWASRPLAEAGGAPFSSLIERQVIAPSGMLRSARKHRDLPLREDLARDLAVPYRVTRGSEPQASDPPPPQGDGAAGGMISTVRDLARFDKALDSGALISDSSRDAMWRPIGPDIPYGLGWFLGTLGGHRVVWHTGLWEGAYSALYLKVPDQAATLLLLANSDGLQWETRLDEAAIERSPFARFFLEWLDPSGPAV